MTLGRKPAVAIGLIGALAAAGCAPRPALEITGTARRDVIVGTSGENLVRARGGNDRIDVRGGGKDRVLCGSGRDTAVLGDEDSAAGCEVRIQR